MTKKTFMEPVDLTIQNVQALLDRHRVSILVGFTVVPGSIPDGLRWYAYLSDQTGYEIGSRPTGRGPSPDSAVIDLFRTLSGKEITLDYDYGRAHLSLVVPPFQQPAPASTTTARPKHQRRRRT